MSAKVWISKTQHRQGFLPRDAMLARYILSSCVRPFVRQSVCLLHAGIVPKQLNTGSRKQRHKIAQGL